MTTEELKELAKQFSNPDGENGVQIGHIMNETNISMTKSSWDSLDLKENDSILELGHGNANHLKELLQKAENLKYVGLEISPTMKEEAEKFCIENNLQNSTCFQTYDGENIPFEDQAFDKIFTVNTIYFWQSPIDLLNEMNRVLKENGLLSITFTDEETMNKLAVTDYGFTKYNEQSFERLINQSSLKLVNKKPFSEMIKTNMPEMVERKYWVMTLRKCTKI